MINIRNGMNQEDWKAALSSEVFREYVKTEIDRMNTKRAEVSSKEDVLLQFAELEEMIKSSPGKLRVFRELKQKFASDPVYAAQADSNLVEAVMLLDLD